MPRLPAGIGSRPTGRDSIRGIIWPAIRAGCMPMAMPGSKMSTDPATSRRSRARPLAIGLEPMADNGSLRRKFVDVHRAQGSATADEAIRRLAQLYAVEKEARGSPPDLRVEIRQAKAAPIVEGLESWLQDQLSTIFGKSPLAAPFHPDAGCQQPRPTAPLAGRVRPRGGGNRASLKGVVDRASAVSSEDPKERRS